MRPELRVRLTGRSSSHFTRVAVMFAHELPVAFDFEVVRDLTSLEPETYGGHPALKIPTLHVGDSSLFGTENICRRLTEIAGRARDPHVVLSEHLTGDVARCAQELVWHAMAAQVQLLVRAAANLPSDDLFFAKVRAGMEGALAWLETHVEEALAELPSPRDVSLLEVTLFCLVEHVAFRPIVPLAGYPKLQAFAAAYGTRVPARRTGFRLDAGAVVLGTR